MLGLILLSLGVFLVSFLSVGVHWGSGVLMGTKLPIPILAASGREECAGRQMRKPLARRGVEQGWWEPGNSPDQQTCRDFGLKKANVSK